MKQGTRAGVIARMDPALADVSPSSFLFVASPASGGKGEKPLPAQQLFSRWILHRMWHAASDMDRAFDAFELDEAVGACRKFWLDELCDVYIEAIKDSKCQETYNVLFTALDGGLRMLHPIAPFLTEDLWQRLKGYSMFGPLPSSGAGQGTTLSEQLGVTKVADSAQLDDPEAQAEVDFLLAVVHGCRSNGSVLAKNDNLVASAVLSFEAKEGASSNQFARTLNLHRSVVCRLASLRDIAIVNAPPSVKTTTKVVQLAGYKHFTLYLQFETK